MRDETLNLRFQINNIYQWHGMDCWVHNSIICNYKLLEKMSCLAQEHNTITRAGLKPSPIHPESSALTTKDISSPIQYTQSMFERKNQFLDIFIGCPVLSADEDTTMKDDWKKPLVLTYKQVRAFREFVDLLLTSQKKLQKKLVSKIL